MESDHTSFHNYNKSGHVIRLFRVFRCEKANGIVVFVIKPFVLEIVYSYSAALVRQSAPGPVAPMTIKLKGRSKSHTAKFGWPVAS